MRKLQEIFDAVIEGGFYREDFMSKKLTTHSSEVMCYALELASSAEDITFHECEKAQTAIETYLQGVMYLETVLRKSGKPCGFADREAIYKNWAKRPRLK